MLQSLKIAMKHYQSFEIKVRLGKNLLTSERRTSIFLLFSYSEHVINTCIRMSINECLTFCSYFIQTCQLVIIILTKEMKKIQVVRYAQKLLCGSSLRRLKGTMGYKKQGAQIVTKSTIVLQNQEHQQ